MTEQKYLKWWNIAGYGSGDVAGNVVYAFLTAFIMIYLTDTAGMNPGIIGTLILLSKLFDGLSDLFFGVLIDRTHSRMGKARPWMFWGYFGVALTLVGCFAIPESMGDTAKYAWFFIAYTLLNAVFYTANNIAYSALTALVTRNAGERVQMGSARFIFAFATSLAIQSVTVQSVDALGGGAEGWRMIAIIYAVIGLAVNSLSVFSVKELPEEELDADAPATGASPTGDGTGGAEHAPGFAETAVLLVRNRYYLLILGFLVVNQVLSTMMGMAIYYFTYILGDKTLVTPFAWAGNIPMIVGLVLTAYLAKTEIGMYRLNLAGYTITLVARVLVIVAAGMGSVPLMLVFTAVAQFGVSPMQGALNALIAEASEYTFLRDGRRMDGAMFSCTSLGIKIGGGVATALAGWMLSASGYVANAQQQPDSAVTMLHAMYLWIPAALTVVLLGIVRALRVERANAALREALETKQPPTEGVPAT
ncbi:MFS transporter [Corynebacterium bovis]|uniref:MFS transporter n=1 Tax=Corynebacterium bovis TaxID=36808 RepID=UPI000F634C7B|nr:glycoside-pentoside-hexuronide (GPH):cation symporter [Corynebacterium bovis]RRO85902.1 MFS transporter [Corynebacterium bovis]